MIAIPVISIVTPLVTPLTKPVENNDGPVVSTKIGKVTYLDGMSRIVCSTILSIFYRCVAIGCALLFLRDSNHYYNSLSKYHHYRAHPLMNKNMVSFSLNTSKHIYKKVTPQTNEYEVLKDRFGLRLENHINDIQSDYTPIDKTKLRQRNICEGICFGMSLDFIAQVINRPHGESETAAIIRVAKTYSNGGNDRAEILQSIHLARDFSNWLKDLDILTTQVDAAINKLSASDQEKMLKMYEDMVDQTAVEKLKGYSKNLNVHFQRPKKSNYENISNGIWYVHSDNHSMVYFKSHEGSFFFDPNHGLVGASTQSGNSLSKEIMNSYIKGGYDLRWINCSLPKN